MKILAKALIVTSALATTSGCSDEWKQVQILLLTEAECYDITHYNASTFVTFIVVGKMMVPQFHINPAHDAASFISKNKFGGFTIASRVGVGSWKVGQKCGVKIFRYQPPHDDRLRMDFN
jgi:hypothetical protein